MKIDKTVGNVSIKLDTKRIDTNIERNAQKALNLAVRIDCDPLVPHLNGELRGSAWFTEGVYGGVLEWNTPYAHYMYAGELYLAANGSSWAKKHEKKYPSGEPLKYHEPGTTSKWFEVAKKNNLKKWEKLVRKEAGKS